MRVQLRQLATVAATPRTAWTFALLRDGEGTATTVELTLGDRSPRVAETLAELLAALRGADLSGELQVAERLGLAPDRLRRDMVLATATSALRSAVTQLDATRAGASLHRFLGAEPTGSVELYANINRALFATARTPADFARAAARAAHAGFRCFKCAPFDEVTPAASPEQIRSLAEPGLARVRAVRDTVGTRAKVRYWSTATAVSPPPRPCRLPTSWPDSKSVGSRSRCSRARRPPTWRQSRAACGCR